MSDATDAEMSSAAGEAVFVVASVAVATGSLSYWGVLVAGALGASAGLRRSSRSGSQRMGRACLPAFRSR